jgi:hypothetical protein
VHVSEICRLLSLSGTLVRVILIHALRTARCIVVKYVYPGRMPSLRKEGLKLVVCKAQLHVRSWPPPEEHLENT